MPSKITLGETRTAVLDRCDMTGSDFPDTSQLDRYINNAIGELYDLLVNIFEDYFIINKDIVITSGTENYSLPDDFYKLIKMFYLSGDDRYKLNRFNLNDLGDNNLYGISSPAIRHSIRYRILGSDFYLHPKPQETGTVEFWYTPEPTLFDVNGDEGQSIGFSVPTQWEEFLFVTAAIPLLDREESDSAPLRATKAEIRNRIVLSAHNRDAAEPDTVQDNRRRFSRSGRYI